MDQNVCVLLFPFIRPVEGHPLEHTLSGTEQSGETVIKNLKIIIIFKKVCYYLGSLTCKQGITEWALLIFIFKFLVPFLE